MTSLYIIIILTHPLHCYRQIASLCLPNNQDKFKINVY